MEKVGRKLATVTQRFLDEYNSCSLHDFMEDQLSEELARATLELDYNIIWAIRLIRWWPDHRPN